MARRYASWGARVRLTGIDPDHAFLGIKRRDGWSKDAGQRLEETWKKANAIHLAGLS